MPITIDTRYQRRGRSQSRAPPRRRRSRSRSAVMRVKKPLALKMHNFVERNSSEYSLAVAKTEGVAVGHHMSFNLDLVRQASSYKELFEFYKIDKIVATFRYKSAGPTANQSTGVSATLPYVMPNEINPVLYFKVDHNDVTTTTISELKDSMKTKSKQLSNNEPEFTITLKPAVQSEAYKSSISTTYIPKWGQWLSTADGSVPHFGLKVFALGTNYIDNNGSIQISYKTYFSCKNNE